MKCNGGNRFTHLWLYGRLQKMQGIEVADSRYSSPVAKIRARSARRNVSPDLPKLSPTVRSNPAQTCPQAGGLLCCIGVWGRPMSHQFPALLRIPLLLPLRFSPLASLPSLLSLTRQCLLRRVQIRRIPLYRRGKRPYGRMPTTRRFLTAFLSNKLLAIKGTMAGKPWYGPRLRKG